MQKIPVLDFEPKSSKEPVLLSSPEAIRWTFSLRYWEQIDYFGLDKSESKWFVSFLNKLKDLSQKEVEKFISDAAEKEAWRYHNINWNQKNIPINREDLTWIDDCYRNNPQDFPILQFQVSKSLGRVVGFWDESNVFNVVLLDPLHNIQPSKSHSYRVDDCSPLSCDYSSMIYKLDIIKKSPKCTEECMTFKDLSKIDSMSISTNVLMHYLNDEDIQELERALQDGGYSVTDILLLGIESLKP